MTRKILMQVLLILMAIIVSAFNTNAQSASPREQLKQYISDLQRYPDDYALREKIIRLVNTMEPKPTLPEEAKRHLGRGIAAFKGARDVNDYKDAVSEFMKASNHAPWVADIYRNLGVAQDKAGQYEDAIRNLKLCIALAPESKDTEEAKSLIYEIEYRQEKAAKNKKLKDAEAERIRAEQNFEGNWYLTSNKDDPMFSNFYEFTIRRDSTNNFIVEPPPDKVFPDPNVFYVAPYVIENIKINGRNIRFREVVTDQRAPWPWKDLNLTLTDGGLLVGTYYMVSKKGTIAGSEISYYRK